MYSFNKDVSVLVIRYSSVRVGRVGGFFVNQIFFISFVSKVYKYKGP